MDKQTIELQAKLDEAKSQNNINADIAKLERNLDKVELQIEIDSKASGSTKKELEKQTGGFKQFLSVVNNTIDKLNSLVKTGLGLKTLFNIGKSNRFCPLWG